MNKKADKSADFTRAGTVRTVLPLVITGIAIILFSTAGLARMMGWGPDWTGNSGDVLAPDRMPLVPAASKSRTRASCAECGEIVSFREIERHDEDTVPGAAGGETAGNADKPRANPTRNYEITIRMADGSSRVIDGANPARWRTGERLIVIDGTNPSYP
jgi:outer membrane lipoprotein SlyB